MMTTEQKQEILIEKFGQQFYNELGERAVLAQRLQGSKPRALDADALKLLNEITEEIYREWIGDEWTCDVCGEKRTGPKNNIYDENFNKQEGVFECNTCFMGERL